MLSARFSSWALASVLLFLLPVCMAQGSKPPANNPGTGGSKRDTGKPPVVTQPGDTSRQVRPGLQTLVITGMVVQEDGSPLPSGAIIERVCGNRVKKEAYVTPSGYFSFMIGSGTTVSGMMPEASDDSAAGFSGYGNRPAQAEMRSATSDLTSSPNLAGCELRARLAGYRSSSVMLDGYSRFGNLDVGTILLQPLSRVQGTLVSVTDMMAPKEAKKSVERADKAMKKNNPAEAEKHLRAAVESCPKYASAWFKLGLVYEQQRQVEGARDAFMKAIAADEKFVNPYFRLARLAGIERKWQEVADITDKALALDPLDFPEGYFFNALAYHAMNKLDIAERSARKAQRLDSLHRIPRVNLLLADILEKRQDWAGCKEQLQAYLNFSPTPADAEHVRMKLQRLDQLSKSGIGKGSDVQ